jgi:hypothetical protein
MNEKPEFYDNTSGCYCEPLPPRRPEQYARDGWRPSTLVWLENFYGRPLPAPQPPRPAPPPPRPEPYREAAEQYRRDVAALEAKYAGNGESAVQHVRNQLHQQMTTEQLDRAIALADRTGRTYAECSALVRYHGTALAEHYAAEAKDLKMPGEYERGNVESLARVLKDELNMLPAGVSLFELRSFLGTHEDYALLRRALRLLEDRGEAECWQPGAEPEVEFWRRKVHTTEFNKLGAGADISVPVIRSNHTPKIV